MASDLTIGLAALLLVLMGVIIGDALMSSGAVTRAVDAAHHWRDAFMRYGQHSPLCSDGIMHGTFECICGFRALNAEAHMNLVAERDAEVG